MSELADFLRRLNLWHLYEIFDGEEILMDDLLHMKNENLKELGIKIGPRTRILRAMEEYKNEMTELGYFLKKLNLCHLYELFDGEEILMEDLLVHMNDETLKELGIKLGPRIRILKAVEEFKNEPQNKPGTSQKGDMGKPDDKYVSAYDNIPTTSSSLEKGSPETPLETTEVSSNPEDETLEETNADDEHNTPAELRRQMTSLLKNEGPAAAASFFQDHLDKWKNIPIKFAVYGRSATGKSSFINAIRGVKYGEEHYAEVGFGDTTQDVMEYIHPNNPKMVFCDIPGYGLMLPRAELHERYDVSSFDFVFLFFDSVLTEEEQSLISKIQEASVPFCLLRTKVDQDVKTGKSMGKNEITVIDEIRRKVQKWMDKTSAKDVKLFIISNEEPQIGEMSKLFSYLQAKLPKAKFEAVSHCLPSITESIIEAKYNELKKRIPYVSVGTGIIAALPIPFVDLPANLYLLKREAEFYTQVFCLDKDYAQTVPGIKTKYYGLSKMQFLQTITKIGMEIGIVAVASQFDLLLPGIGSIISGFLTKHAVSRLLLRILDDVKADAYIVYKFLLTQKKTADHK